MVSYPTSAGADISCRFRLLRAIAPLAGSAEYELLEDSSGSSAIWIKSVEQPEAAFQLIDAGGCIPGFCIEPDAAACESIGLSGHADARIMLLVEPSPTGMRVNFSCPLILNPKTGLATQVQATASPQWQPPTLREPAHLRSRSRSRWQASLAFMA
ncbi:MAG: flagellar assembly protein FliW [Phycisphaerales bacterium]|nr:flagellar assembly protein FliW [Phycisphaerales bacterium]